MMFRSTCFCAIILIIYSHHVKSECCSNRDICDTWCCGCGACNIFCCNCDHGCNLEWWHVMSYVHQESGYEPELVRRLGGHKVDGEYDHVKVCDHWRRKRVVLKMNRNISDEALNAFKDIDVDGSKTITIHEANEYLENQKLLKRSIHLISVEQEFRKMDTNNDDFISPNEFDESL